MRSRHSGFVLAVPTAGMDSQDLSSAAETIRHADSVVAMTGAGVSTASGIPDFRSEDGLWNRYDPNDFHVSRFRADPEGFWRDRVEIVKDLFGGDIEPNAAHHALADLEGARHLDTLITQNVDGLHQAAGSEDPIEIHGNGQRTVCTDCDSRFDIDPVMDRVTDGETPPTCTHCGGVLKPDVILFGEPLPENELRRAQAASRNADVFLAIGSSLTVEPAASLPRHAIDRGASLLILNLDRTELSDRATYEFRADVTELLPALAERVTEEEHR
jgi:NAD-dependent deacetylase